MKNYIVTAAALVCTSAHAYEPAGTPDDWDPPMGGHQPYWLFMGDRIETGLSNDVDSYVWDVQGWYGGNHNRAVFKSEGEGEQWDSPEDAELQLLYSRLFAPFWEWQIGVRQVFSPDPDRTYAVLGLQGVMPYEFEWDSALFISEEGKVSARIEAEYDINVTQRLILQPRVELNAALSDDRAIGAEAGLLSSEAGIRLRYQLRREISPYFGIAWEQLYGSSKDAVREAGESASVTALVLGVQLWF